MQSIHPDICKGQQLQGLLHCDNTEEEREPLSSDGLLWFLQKVPSAWSQAQAAVLEMPAQHVPQQLHCKAQGWAFHRTSTAMSMNEDRRWRDFTLTAEFQQPNVAHTNYLPTYIIQPATQYWAILSDVLRQVPRYELQALQGCIPPPAPPF